jgi:hypothetical protein
LILWIPWTILLRKDPTKKLFFLVVVTVVPGKVETGLEIKQSAAAASAPVLENRTPPEE